MRRRNGLIGIGMVSLFAGAAVGATTEGTKIMPAEQQNKLVATYCEICHSDAHPNGRLSFEHFDAAKTEPAIAQIMAAKLRTGAIGAAGLPRPDQPTQDALFAALTAEAAGAQKWFVEKGDGKVTTASILRELPSTDSQAKGIPDYYRLVVSCNTGTKVGGMDLEWSPGVPKNGNQMQTMVDGKPSFQWTVEGAESMGNGQAGTSGPGAVSLKASLPKDRLSVTGLFPDETVVFPFGELDKKARRELSACFSGK
jgi:hypothetical protein